MTRLICELELSLREVKVEKKPKTSSCVLGGLPAGRLGASLLESTSGWTYDSTRRDIEENEL
jgi:hypothetical protein